MTATSNSGPKHSWGLTSGLFAPPQGSPVPDPNQDAGPDLAYQGFGFLDPRFWYPKDKVEGYTGVVAAHLPLPLFKSNGGVPSALAAGNIAADQNVTNGTAMTLAAASLGIATNIPMRPFGPGPQAIVNGQPPITVPIVLEFGFGFAAVTAGSPTMTVPDSSIYTLGMPLVIGQAGNAAGTAPLLTNVVGIPAGGITVTLNPNALPVAAQANAPVGLGDIWGPSEIGFPLPLAHAPFLAGGPDLLFDYRQNMGRGLQITAADGAVGGNILVSGLDVYGQPMTWLAVAAAGSTVWSTKVFKAVLSAVPQFTDGSHNYEIGTSDLFGFAYRANLWEDTRVFWDGAAMTSVTGFVAAVTSAPTGSTGDVRGTVQVSSNGPASGIGGGAASNGSLTGNVMTGNRLEMGQFPGIQPILNANPTSAVSLFGQIQA